MNKQRPINLGASLPDEYASLRNIVLKPLKRRGGIRGFLRYAHAIGVRKTVGMTIYLLRVLIGAGFDRLYDRCHQVDTCGCITPKHLDVDGPSREFSEYYAPTPEKSFRMMLNAVPVNFRDYTFVDYGCGKGRALLIAAEHPFRRIMGVEHSTSLAQIAANNIACYRTGVTQCEDIEVLRMDATKFEPPPGPCLFYFFSPFKTTVLRQVLKYLERSYRRDPRPMVILFSEEKNTTEIPTSLVEEMECMKLIKESSLPFDLGAPVPMIYAVYANVEALQYNRRSSTNSMA